MQMEYMEPPSEIARRSILLVDTSRPIDGFLRLARRRWRT